MQETPITSAFKRMPEEPISRAYKRLRRMSQELRELTDDTQEVHHNLFLRTLHLQKDFQSTLKLLLEAAPDLADD